MTVIFLKYTIKIIQENQNKSKLSDRKLDAGLPPTPFSKTVGASDSQAKEVLVNSNMAGAQSTSNLHSNQEKKVQGSQGGFITTATAGDSNALILSRLKQPKFFKSRKQSHSK